MKARTKAQKRASKRGRPILAANLDTREPNGRPSRRQQRTELLEHQIVEVAAARRVRHLSLVDTEGETALKQALDPRRGYLLGRMLLDGSITEAQHDAGIRYAEDMARYYGLTGIPFPSARAQDLFAVSGAGGEDSEEKGKRARAARDRMVALRDRLLACGDISTGRRVEHTVKVVCVEDMDHLRTLNPPMQAWLRQGLNALGNFYNGGGTK